MLELEQGIAGGNPRLDAQRQGRGLVGEHQNVARAQLLACHLHAAGPFAVGRAELVAFAEQQGLPVRLAQVRQEAVHRAHLAAVPGLRGRRRHARQGGAVGLEAGRIRRPIDKAVVQLAVGIDVEGLGRTRPLHQDHAARPQRMAHPQFIPDIGVVQGEIGHHQVGHQQLLEHVGADVAGALLLVGAEHLEARRLERRADVFAIDAVEVDRLAVVPWLGTEGHGDEGVWFHVRRSRLVAVGSADTSSIDGIVASSRHSRYRHA